MSNRIIVGVNISARTQTVPDVQTILTEFGCNIRVRLGLHEVSGASCSPGGLLILDMFGDEQNIHDMAAKLAELPGVEVRKMVFTQ
jgi:hypothetical protein